MTLLRKHCNVKSFPSICLMFTHCTLRGKCPNQRECFGKYEMLSGLSKIDFESNLDLASLTWYAQRIALKAVTPTSDPRV